MFTNLKRVITGAAWLAACSGIAFGQGQRSVVLEIDAVNCLSYQGDVADYSKLATDPNATAGIPSKNFSTLLTVCDIAHVNGTAVKGMATSWNATLNARPNATPGAMISDITRSNIHMIAWEFLQRDGTPIGGIMGEGYGGGGGIPGAPLSLTQGNNVVSGGTGAFLGVRGQWGTTASKNVPAPLASVSEDPSNRRARQGGAFHHVIQLIPASYPAVVMSDSGPLIWHASDYSPVNEAKPAGAGEVITMAVSALGPTHPGVNPGEVFPVDPPQSVNGPVQVLLNGQSCDVLQATGYPGTMDWYLVSFRVPAGAPAALATLQVVAAWIPGPLINIPIR